MYMILYVFILVIDTLTDGQALKDVERILASKKKRWETFDAN